MTKPDTDTHTVTTIYGEATVETVECASCGNRVAADSAEPFTIGEGLEAREGYACEHCVEEPVAFPVRGGDHSLGLLAFGVAMAPFALMISDFEDPMDFSYLQGFFGGVFWTLALALVFEFFATITAGGAVPI